MLYLKKPPNFFSKFRVSSCFVENPDGKFVLLYRQSHKAEGDKWGAPAGKIKKGETPRQAIIREIEEELGISLPSSEISHFQKVFVRYPNYDFVYHIFFAKLNQTPQVKINPKEHQSFQWSKPRESLNLPLVRDQEKCVQLFYKI